MGNPITDLWNTARSHWLEAIRGYNDTWQIIYSDVTLPQFKTHVTDALYRLNQSLLYETVLAGTSILDLATNTASHAVYTFRALDFLRWTIIPDYASLALHQAREYAQTIVHHEALDRQLGDRHEALDRQIGDLRERLAMDVAVAQEHADMVTRIAIETNDRILMVQHEALDRAQADAAETAARILMVQHEALDRAQADALILRYAESIPPLEDARAAAGYDPTLKDHATGMGRLLDTAVAHEPLIAAVVGKLTTWLVDLAEVDDPLIRLAAQFVLKELINKFGVDTAVGTLLSDLLGPVLSGGPPKTLQTVIGQIGTRLNGLEAGLAALSPLGPEADDLHELGTVIFDAAMLGYVGFAIADPVRAADDTTTVLETVIGPLLTPLRDLLGMP